MVALDWKWLFLYPEQGIATVNELAAPVDRPIAVQDHGSSSVMNTFFVPALAGMIYAMPGMETKLHAVINKPGVYDGLSANYSGDGFSHMRFKFHGLSDAEFDKWVQQREIRRRPRSPRMPTLKLAEPSERVPVRRYCQRSPPACSTPIVNRCVDSRANVHGGHDGDRRAAGGIGRGRRTDGLHGGNAAGAASRRRRRPCVASEPRAATPCRRIARGRRPPPDCVIARLILPPACCVQVT